MASSDPATHLSILWLRERFGWMGSHSGYDQLCRVMPTVQAGRYLTTWRDLTQPPPRRSQRFLSWMARNVNPSPFYGLTSTAAEVATVWQCFRQRPDLVHVTYVENQLGLLPGYGQRLSYKVVGTGHQPTSWWRLHHPHPESVADLDALIVLSSSESAYFRQFLGDRVHVIPHGVDTQFFRPTDSVDGKQDPRFIFSGSWLRDLTTLLAVIERVLAKAPAIQFDMIVPYSKRQNDYFYRLARYPQVNWHGGISDHQLCQLYQQASGLLLPLLDCTANNALLEAIACGLPVITNDVGGVRDYTQPSFSTLLPLGDVDGFVDAILEIADSPDLLRRRGTAARQFAEQKLDWHRVAQQTFDLYQRVSHEDRLH
ncbi:MAG: glycosyltransferase family 4 protein [Nodosilinea sp.]